MSVEQEHFFTAAILAIVSATTGVTVNKAIEAVNEKWRKQKEIDNFILYGEYDVEKLYLSLARIYQDNKIKKCKITKFEERDDGIIIELVSKDKRYRVKTDKT